MKKKGSRVPNKRAFTTIETLTAIIVCSAVMFISTGIISLMSKTLFFGQAKTSDSIHVYENINYLLREVHSAQNILVSDKSMKIKQYGRADYNLHYTIEADNYLKLNGRNMFITDYANSRFTLNGKAVNMDFGAAVFEAAPRSTHAEVRLE